MPSPEEEYVEHDIASISSTSSTSNAGSSLPDVKEIIPYNENFNNTTYFSRHIKKYRFSSEKTTFPSQIEFVSEPYTGTVPGIIEEPDEQQFAVQTASLGVNLKENIPSKTSLKRQEIDEEQTGEDVFIIWEKNKNILAPATTDNRPHRKIRIIDDTWVTKSANKTELTSKPKENNFSISPAIVPVCKEPVQPAPIIEETVTLPSVTIQNVADLLVSLKVNVIKQYTKLYKTYLVYYEKKKSLLSDVEQQKIKNQINQLKYGIDKANSIRNLIYANLFVSNGARSKCKKCNHEFDRPGNLINHGIKQHPEILNTCNPTEIDNDANTICNDSADAGSLISYCHSIHSQITLPNYNSPRPQIATTNESDDDEDVQILTEISIDKPECLTPPTSSVINLQNSNQQVNIRDVSYEEMNFSTSLANKNSPIFNGQTVVTNSSIDNVPVTYTNGNVELEAIREISQDDTIWKNVDIGLAPRKPVVLFNNSSLKLFEKHARTISKWIKRGQVTNIKLRKGTHSYVDDDISLRRYFLDLIHTKEELQQVQHCFGQSQKLKDPCDACKMKLVEIEASQYIRSNTAFQKYEKVSKSKGLSKQEKNRLLKELLNQKNEFKLVRSRLEMVREKRGKFNQIPEIVKYNKNWFLCLQKAFNDTKIQEYVQFNQAEQREFGFGIHCYKLMDDIVNEFLVQITVTCMNFARSGHKVMLGKELLYQYQALFKTTNRDATFLESHSTEIRAYLKEQYVKHLPSTKILEVLIIDGLLRQSFGDENLMHENLDSLIFEHLKSPQPIFKFLMYMKYKKDYLIELNSLLLRLIFQLAVEVLKLKKRTNSNNLVRYDELIEACEIVGVFNSSYTYYLKQAYKQYQEKTLYKLNKKGYILSNDGTFKKRLGNFLCECGVSFNNMSSLNAHKRRTHPNADFQEYVFGSFKLTPKDIRNLCSGEAIDDVIIDSILYTFEHNYNKIQRKRKIIALPTSIVKLYQCNGQVDGIITTIQNIDHFSTILVPWHVGKIENSDKYDHWILIEIKVNEREILLYDSSNSNSQIANIENKLKYLLKRFSNVKWNIQEKEEIAKQSGGSSDCGVYLIYYAECILWPKKNRIENLNVHNYRNNIKKKIQRFRQKPDQSINTQN